MEKFTKQLVIISDPLSPEDRKRYKPDLSGMKDLILSQNLIYSGLTPGPELDSIKIAYENNIPYVAAIAYATESKYWPVKAQQKYNFYKKKALKKVYVDRQQGFISPLVKPGEYQNKKIANQIIWLANRAKLDNKKTKIVFFNYNFGISYKKQNLDLALSFIPQEHWDLIHKGQIHEPQDEDDLPF